MQKFDAWSCASKLFEALPPDPADPPRPHLPDFVELASDVCGSVCDSIRDERISWYLNMVIQTDQVLAAKIMIRDIITVS